MQVHEADRAKLEANIVISRHVPVAFENDEAPLRPGTTPVKEFSPSGPRAAGRDAERFTGEPDMPGQHVLFLLTRKDSGEMPVVKVSMADGEDVDALMIFTRRESAVLYVQVARTDDYNVASFAPDEVRRMLKAMSKQGIDALLADPNRRHQEDGLPAGAVVDLSTIGNDPSGENLYQEIFDRVGGL